MSDNLSGTAMRLVGYYDAGDIGRKNYFVTDIPGDLLSHVIYAFAGLTPEGICVSLSPEDDDTNFPELTELKATFPQLEVLISVGGADHSANFSTVAAQEDLRQQFVQSTVEFMAENGFDGIDIDWEFPSASDSANFTTLLQELRKGLEAQAEADGQEYLLTIAAPAGEKNITNLQLSQIYPLVDWINLETYDFHTAHSKDTNFNAPLFTVSGDLCVDRAVASYLAGGVPAEKIVLGTRFVGTGWQGVGANNNGLNQPATGPAPGTWDDGATPSGSIGYGDIENRLAVAGYTRGWDSKAQAPWLYNQNVDGGTMISYEDPESLTAKINYAISKQLGGIMIWELGSDDSTGTLVNAVAANL